MNRARGDRGRSGGPLWALGSLFLCWIAARVMLFEMPFERPRLPYAAPAAAKLAQGPPDARPTERPSRAAAIPAARDLAIAPRPLPVLLPPPAHRMAAYGPDQPSPATLGREPQAHRRAAGHNLLWMAAMQAMPLLPEVQALVNGEPEATPPGGQGAATRVGRASRWSGDGWLVWRSGARGLAASGAVTPVYGGSQAGALLRYALAPASPHRPVGYVRVVRALHGPSEGDIALGGALRPLSGLPVTAHAEARLARRGPELTVRPAAFLSAGVDSVPLARGVALRGYGQAGYVGGRDATGFADGSLVAEKAFWTDRDSALTAGAGAWGGVQRGAGRLDLGPTASLRFRLGEGTARVSADYRLRVAGDAAPARGAAVTLSAGF